MEENKEVNVKQKNSTPIIIILIFIIMALGGVIAYLLINNTANKKESKNENKTEQKVEVVNLSESEANNLISYVPVHKYLHYDYTGFTKQKLLTTEMDNNVLTFLAMQKVNKQKNCTPELEKVNGLCDFTLETKEVEKSLNNLYGVKIELPKVVTEFIYKCTLNDDIYICSNTGGGATTLGPVTSYFVFSNNYVAKYQKAEKDNNNLYIYIKFARMEVNIPYNNKEDPKPEKFEFQLYKYGTGHEKITDDIINGKDYYEENSTFADKVYEKFKDKMTTYKITYKINDSNYTLTSVEPIK